MSVLHSLGGSKARSESLSRTTCLWWREEAEEPEEELPRSLSREQKLIFTFPNIREYVEEETL